LAVMPGACGAAKPVAIKWLWPELARDPECVRMFLDEARLSLSLHHPNVIHTYESGHDGSRYYLTMEYLDGQSLKHVLDGLACEGGLSLPLGLKVISDVLAGLEYVHCMTHLDGMPMHIVHRDVSPQNVFLTYNGEVKLVDFGIAETASTRDRSRLVRVEGRLTYMAPEQAADDPIDHRADLFSVGVMLWEIVMGRRLWQGMTDAAILDHLLSGRPLPRLPDTRGFPPALADICARALALDPADRYGSAAEFQADLAAVLTGSAPVQARLLGHTISRLFSSQRALVRSMIQQSLMPAGPALPSLLAPPAAQTDTQAAPRSEAAPGSAVVLDRFSGTQIVAFGDDATAVGPVAPVDLRAPQRTLRWLGAVALLGVIVCGIALASRTVQQPVTVAAFQPRPPSPSPAAVISVPQPAIPATAPASPPTAQMGQRRPPVAPQPTKRPPSRSRRHSLPVETSPAIAQDLVESPATPTPASPDSFDSPLVAKRRPVARPIDREDPYAP